jgi:phage terminase Nu1 subunit (DNA packaging protein)
LANQEQDERLFVHTALAAKVVGITTQAFAAWDTEPVRIDGQKRIYYIPDVVDELVRRRSAEAVKAALTERGSGGGRAGQLASLDAEKTRLAAAQADKHELENAVRRGELLSIESISKAWSYVITSVRAKLLSLPTKCAPELAMMNDPGSIRDRLTTELHAALSEAADYRPDHGISDDRQTDSSDALDIEATAEMDGERMGRRAEVPI